MMISFVEANHALVKYDPLTIDIIFAKKTIYIPSRCHGT